MDLAKAIELYKNDVKFGDIRQQIGLSHSQMFLLDGGMRLGKSQNELELMMYLVDDTMSSVEIKKLLEEK